MGPALTIQAANVARELASTPHTHRSPAFDTMMITSMRAETRGRGGSSVGKKAQCACTLGTHGRRRGNIRNGSNARNDYVHGGHVEVQHNAIMKYYLLLPKGHHKL